MSYHVIRHPRSGDDFACELDNRTGVIISAAEPLTQYDRRDSGALQDYIDNQLNDNTRDDAAWLNNETGRL